LATKAKALHWTGDYKPWMPNALGKWVPFFGTYSESFVERLWNAGDVPVVR
jgi:hypothetical protein